MVNNMTKEIKKLKIQEDAASALRLALKGILGQIPTMFKDAGNCNTIGTQCDFAHLEAEIEIALSRHDLHIKYGTNPIPYEMRLASAEENQTKENIWQYINTIH